MEINTTPVFSAIALVGLAFLLELFRQQEIDRFRQRMFELRDALFLDAANGLIDFDHPAYGELRTTMNGFIRFAHRLSIWHALIGTALSPGWGQEEGRQAVEEWKRRTRDLDENQRKRLDGYRLRMLLLIFQHFARVVPDCLFVWPVLFAVFLWFLVKNLLHKVDPRTVFQRSRTDTAIKFAESSSAEELSRLALLQGSS